MKNEELSSLFDTLYNNVTSNQAPGLNEAEKSVFLTKAQSMLLKEYFNPRTDGVGGGFDGNQQRQYDFSSLIRVARLFDVNTFKERITSSEKLDKRSKVYLFPQDYFLTVNEILSDTQRQYSVLPLSYDEYQRLMLKPYNFPVKRAAWRLITDKKNCNYGHYIFDSNGDLEKIEDNQAASSDYIIETSWADQKRNIELTIMVSNLVTEAIVKNAIKETTNTVDYSSFSLGDNEPTLHFAKVWSDDNKVYKICIGVEGSEAEDDEEVMEFLQNFFKNIGSSTDATILKICEHLDGLAMCSAPSHFTNFFKEEDFTPKGTTFTTHVINLPLAEIIGKFNDGPNYQLRYVKRPRPIVLEDLTDYDDEFSIEGITTKTECELPAEMHQEIVERAVTLAKIAWAGSTATAQAAQQRENK